ncbi:hypothetical protein ACHQM5_014243 [Ranunculus cassubicifolius]
MMYPRVKVRDEEKPVKVKNGVDVQEKRNSLLLLNNLITLTLKDQFFTDKEYTEDSPPTVAKVPKSYVPSFTTPSISLSKEKNNRETEDSRPNIRASSVPPPRAVLSSPDNDGLIGSRNQLSKEKPSVMKKSNLGETTDSQGKAKTRNLKSKTPVNTRVGSKEITNNKSGIKVKQKPELTVPKQSGYLRKGRQRSTDISSSKILPESHVKV